MEVQLATEQARVSLREGLIRLGRTAAEVADWLRTSGDHGLPGDPEHNPLSRHLARHLGLRVIFERGGCYFRVRGTDALYAVVDVPLGCHWFLVDFANGSFPDLKNPREDCGGPRLDAAPAVMGQ
jgi:hypothetical protein